MSISNFNRLRETGGKKYFLNQNRFKKSARWTELRRFTPTILF